MNRTLGLALAAAALPALPASANAGDFVDTRLVFIAGDDDFSHDAGTTVPSSPTTDIGSRVGYDQFYDQLDSSETGRESRTSLVLYKAVDGYFPGLTTAAGIVLELNHSRLLNGDPRALQDDGSYIRVTNTIGEGKIDVLLMPFRSDRLRLGYLWDITWGGDGVFPGTSPVPGAKVAYDQPLFGVYGGMKTSRLPYNTDEEDTRKGQLEAFFGFFGGARVGYEADGFRGDVGVGRFEKGTNPNGSVRGEPVNSWGASARLAFIDGLPFTPGNDLRIYTSDPSVPYTEWTATTETMAWRLAVEATRLEQILEDPDSVGGTKAEVGLAGAAYGQAQIGMLRLGLTGIFRDLAFIHFNGPGAVHRFQALPDDLETNGELTATASVQYRLADWHLTPGLELGFQQPAGASNLVPQAGIHAPSVLTGRRTVVYRRADMFDDMGLTYPAILPDGADILPTLGGRLSLQFDLAKGFGLTGAFTVLQDNNRAELVQDRLQVNTLREFGDSLTFGASVMARAEF